MVKGFLRDLYPYHDCHNNVTNDTNESWLWILDQVRPVANSLSEPGFLHAQLAIGTGLGNLSSSTPLGYRWIKPNLLELPELLGFQSSNIFESKNWRYLAVEHTLVGSGLASNAVFWWLSYSVQCTTSSWSPSFCATQLLTSPGLFNVFNFWYAHLMSPWSTFSGIRTYKHVTNFIHLSITCCKT